MKPNNRKNAEIKVMVTTETKKNLREKAKKLGLTMTGYIEKLANEDNVFLDDNVKNLMGVMGKIFPNSS